MRALKNNRGYVRARIRNSFRRRRLLVSVCVRVGLAERDMARIKRSINPNLVSKKKKMQRSFPFRWLGNATIDSNKKKNSQKFHWRRTFYSRRCKAKTKNNYSFLSDINNKSIHDDKNK